MIRFVCECGQQLQAREENAGAEVACPSCGRQQTVPAATEDAIQISEAAPPPTAGSENIQRGRPALAAAPEGTEFAAQAGGTSGKAIACLVLAIPSVLCSVLTGLPAVLFGVLALRDIGRSQGRLSGHGLAIAGIITACVGTLVSCSILVPVGLLLPAVQKVREAAARVQSQNNLKLMSLAMHSYNDMNGLLPAAAICDKAGRPLLSWRVAILPALGENALYSRFKLDEPWDSPNNIKLLANMPKVYNCPAAQTAPGETVYRVFVGNGAAFEQTRGLRMPADFPDGPGNVILIVEAKQSVPWTKPDDLPFHPNQPLPALGGHFVNGFNAAGADGAVHFIPKNTPEQRLRQLIQRNDGPLVTFP